MPDAPIVKRLIRDEKSEFFHSSAYGRAQSGGTIGAASTESFDQRRKIDENRQNIRKYDDSLVAEQRYNPEGAGATRVDQPVAETGGKAAFYEGMLNAAKENSGIDPTKSTTSQPQQGRARRIQDSTMSSAEKLARQLGGQGKISQQEMEKRIEQARQDAENQNRGGAYDNGAVAGGQNRGGRGGNGQNGGAANLSRTAAQRAEMSARYADKSRRPMGGPVGGPVAGGKPQSVTPMRQFRRPSGGI